MHTSGKMSHGSPLHNWERGRDVQCCRGCSVLMDEIVREVNENLQGGVQLPSTNVQILLFVDNI